MNRPPPLTNGKYDKNSATRMDSSHSFQTQANTLDGGFELITDIANIFLGEKFMRRETHSSCSTFGCFRVLCPVFLVRRQHMHRIKDGSGLHAPALKNFADQVAHLSA